ncbi:tRNA (adenosine(37)-N6)-threonylcarbamoyltransferase complex dimerization subunit type 1 TsaB [Cellulomonas sp. PSBB021]|uniref:tRNA (adenosine(37)-N6)-threonylcarbamoyltransferase complex dimerization subunit type 1 TsaB n=1 Tax=Cellulomonas sp. PSBB021 TaxID=2003551 RepID=UPI000B8D7274|nr:tRNA (adenosine(37)-N6)-threonylcarbamoyltransferase complex dimerization subunit type 1 TsaB [Cellulomonas sp. PSBB021]ASR55222.1 tRNA (adenosine(37)-N6)-threonylcarbamoyltransferase complex dimerization subunit type 1 TsaB [Cellulomonas sp. PSBB021]
MPLLALDTSSSVSVAVTDDAGSALVRHRADLPRHHAELLAPLVAEALADAGVDRRELSAVVVGTGPAPFTGLRVGLVSARTLALALGVPALGVPSLDALAAAATRAVPTGAPLVVATDARRREVYWAAYRRDEQGVLGALVEPRVGPAHEVADEPAVAGGFVVGAGTHLYPDAFAGLTHVAGADDLDAAELVPLALARRAAGEALGTDPLYLRRPDAVPSAGSKRVLGG